MRSENIQAWAEGVVFGQPPPVQPPFDEYGTPVFSYQDAKVYLNRIGNRVAEIAVLERSSPQQKILLRNGGVKDLEVSNTQRNEHAKTQKTEPGNTQKTQQANTHKTELANQDAEAYLDRQRKILFQNRGAKDRKPVQKDVPFNPDREAYMKAVLKRQKEKAEHERMTRERKILFPNSIPTGDPKPDPGPYKIPTTRKPVPKSNDTTPTPPQMVLPPRKPVPQSNDTTPPPPQMVLLRNGETKKLENIPSYTERVRDLGYPEALCSLVGTEIGAEHRSGGDCTSAKVVKEKVDCQSSHQDQGSNRPGYTDGTCSSRAPLLAPESSLSPRETLTLALRPAGTALPNDMSRATIRDVVDLGIVSSSTRS